MEGFEKVGLGKWKREHAAVDGEKAGLGRPSHSPEEVEMKLLHHREPGGQGSKGSQPSQADYGAGRALWEVSQCEKN